MTVKYDITIPDKIIKALGFKESEVASEIKKELAVYFFQRGG